MELLTRKKNTSDTVPAARMKCSGEKMLHYLIVLSKKEGIRLTVSYFYYIIDYHKLTSLNVVISLDYLELLKKAKSIKVDHHCSPTSTVPFFLPRLLLLAPVSNRPGEKAFKFIVELAPVAISSAIASPLAGAQRIPQQL